jgi:hypothetical protein
MPPAPNATHPSRAIPAVARSGFRRPSLLLLPAIQGEGNAGEADRAIIVAAVVRGVLRVRQ